MSLTVLIIVDDQDRSRDFYHHVLGAEIARGRDPVILRSHNGMIVLNVGGGPADDKPTVTTAPPAYPDTVSIALTIRVADIQAVYQTWRSRGRSSSPSPGPGRGDPLLPARPGRVSDRSRPDDTVVRPQHLGYGVDLPKTTSRARRGRLGRDPARQRAHHRGPRW
jgi:catechol 2,3-dioxygenase-like lactoylglutathione lyase family enzyme